MLIKILRQVFLYLLLTLTLCIGPQLGYAEGKNKHKLENVSILIPSCDKYAEAWDPFFKLLFKYWPNLDQKIYLIAGDKTYPDSRVQAILIGKEKSWSDNMLIALDKIPEDYILICLEDYFILNPVNEERLSMLFNQMKQDKAAYLSLVNVSESEKIPHLSVPSLGYLAQTADYRTALQVAIWDKAALKKLLVAGENPWQFEMKGTERSRDLKMPFLVTVKEGPINYFGAIDRGHWNERAITFLEKENLQVDFKLPLDSPLRRWIRGPLRGFVGYYIAKPIRNMVSYFKQEANDANKS